MKKRAGVLDQKAKPKKMPVKNPLNFNLDWDQKRMAKPIMLTNNISNKAKRPWKNMKGEARIKIKADQAQDKELLEIIL